MFVFSYDGRPEHCEDGPALAGEGGGFAEVCVTGLTRATFAANFGSDYGEDPVEGERLSFGAVLAIFFPAVSGTRPTTTATRCHTHTRLLPLLTLPPIVILSLPRPPPPPL